MGWVDGRKSWRLPLHGTRLHRDDHFAMAHAGFDVAMGVGGLREIETAVDRDLQLVEFMNRSARFASPALDSELDGLARVGIEFD